MVENGACVCDNVGKRDDGGEGDKMGGEGNELMQVHPQSSTPRIYLHRNCEEKFEAIMKVTQVKHPKVLASLSWISGYFFNLINPEN